MRFDKLAERQILKAQSQGQLDDLEGTGKPLGHNASGDAAQEAGFRIMADAGVVPREFELRREAETIRAELASVTEPAQRKALMARLADIEMRRAIEVEARKKFLRP